MVDHVKALGRKLTFPKLAMFGYTLLMMLWFMSSQFPELEVIRQINFENLFGSSWFFIIGGAFILESMLAFSDLKKGSAKIAGYMVLGVGIIAVIFGGMIFFEGVNVFNGNEVTQWIAVFVLGMGSILFFTMVSSEIFKRKSFLHLVQSNL